MQSHPAVANTELTVSNRLRFGILVIFIVLGVIYSFATPIFEKNDEESHAWFVRFLAQGNGLPVQVPGTPDAALHREGSQPPLYYALAALMWRQFDTSDFDLELEPNASPTFNPYSPGNKNLLIITPEKLAFHYRNTTLAALVLRLLGIVGGCVTLWATYGIANALTRKPYIALFAMALVAFNPMYITVATAVSNDGLVIACSTVGLYLLVQLLLDGVTTRRIFILGAVIGLTSLSKVSGLLILPIALLVILCRERLSPQQPNQSTVIWLRSVIKPLALLIAIWLAMAGWWYLRNWNLYGDFTGAAVMAQMMTPRNLTIFQALSEVRGFEMSFIGIFGQFAVPMDDVVYGFFDAILLLGGIGLGVFLIRTLRGATGSHANNTIRLRMVAGGALLLHVLLLSVSILEWTTHTPASQGRLLFPALGTIATLLAVGLTELGRSWKLSRNNPAKTIALFAALPFLLVSVIAPWRTIIPAYTPPLLNRVPDSVVPAQQRMGSLAQLLGFTMAPREVHPGEKVRVTAVFRVLSVPRDNYLLVTKLYGRDNAELVRFDTYTGGGLYPSSQWRVGDIWQDVIEFGLPASALSPGILRAQFDLYNRGSGDLVQSSDSQGRLGSPLFDGSTLMPVTALLPDSTPVLGRIGDLAELIAYTRTMALAGQPMEVKLTWHTLRQASKDYTVFVHLVDSAGKIQSQSDAPPDNGNFPTSRWEGNIVFRDTHLLPMTSPLPAGEYRLEAGIYDASDGQRLEAFNRDHQIVSQRALILDDFVIR